MAAFNRITYIGHATVLLEMDSVSLITDPLLRNRVFHLHRRSAPVAASLFREVVAVLISHAHWDHLDIPSLLTLGRETQLIVPAGATRLLHRRGFKKILDMRPGDKVEIGGLAITATYAEHHSRLLPPGPTVECLGFLIQGSQSIYFAGDTDLFPGMAGLADHLDIALLPVWGWGPNLGRGHMDPRRAAEALTLLHPRIAIPIHWGTFYPRWMGWLRPHLLSEPQQLFKREAGQLMPQVEVQILTPGSALTL